MRKVEVEAGRSVLASLRKKNGVPVDNALIEWAESQDLAVRIDRSSLIMTFGNPAALLLVSSICQSGCFVTIEKIQSGL
jgi:hypothetical protein